MGLREWLWLVVISALWGGSFLFMRVAAPALGPVLLVALRVLIAGVVLAAATRLARRLAPPGPAWRSLAVMGALNSALPFVLFAEGLRHIPASLAAPLNATTPLFSAVAAALWLREPLTARRIAGMSLGLLGVTLLVGRGPVEVTPGVIRAAAGCLVAAGCYGIAAVYAKKRLAGVPPLAVATYSQLLAALALLPLVPAALPREWPQPGVLGAVVALAVLSTALPYTLYFQLIARAGAVQATTVTYLGPAFGVVWSVLLLGEPLTAGMLAGFGLILCGALLINKPVAAAPPAGTAGRLAATLRQVSATSRRTEETV